MGTERQFIPLRISVLTVSDTRVEENDTSGKTLAERLQEAGHVLADKKMVNDDIYNIRAAVSNWIADESVDVVISTGGTGVTGRDGTPEAIQPLFDKEIEGFGELFRSLPPSNLVRSPGSATAPISFASLVLRVPAVPDGTKSSKINWITGTCPVILLNSFHD